MELNLVVITVSASHLIEIFFKIQFFQNLIFFCVSVLYHKGPEFTHASYVVLVSDNEVNQNNLDVQSNYRVSDTTGKGLIILKVTRPDGLEYSNYFECFNRLSEFKVTEIIPKRFQSKQLTTQNS